MNGELDAVNGSIEEREDTMYDYLDHVAIIGAGLGGCALGVALSVHHIPVTIYEARTKKSAAFASGVVLTPNGLRILDKLGILSRIRDRCYTTTHRVFKNDRDETIKKTLVAHEALYGYRNHRIWRSILLDEMRAILAERGVVMHYEAKLTGITSDSSSGVTFVVNGEEKQASLLMGSDGIYSTVRKQLSPNTVPEYTGIVGVLSHVRWDSVAWPYADYERNATIQGKPGAIFWIAEDPNGEEIMTGMQVSYPEQSREDLEALQADKDRLVGFYRKGYDQHGPTARSIIDAIAAEKQKCYIWPYLRMPKLDKWYSESGRVILTGDAAHALPPSSGQGVNQALEDVYALTTLLTRAGQNARGRMEETALLKSLGFWQDMREKRVDRIFDWATNATNVQRMSEEEREKRRAEGSTMKGEGDDMAWLYAKDVGVEAQDWMKSGGLA